MAAAAFLSSAHPLCSAGPSSSSSSSPLTGSRIFHTQNHDARQNALCRASNAARPHVPLLTKRSLSLCLISGFFSTLAGSGCSEAYAAILEADDDEELLERVKKDRKKRLERQGVISSSNKETGYLQDLVYNLSKIGQAIDNNDLPTASAVLGGSAGTDWIQKANIAFSKLSSSPEEKTEVDTFNSSLASLISSVIRNDVESSKVAFVSSASAFEKWTALSGLVGQLKGL